MDGRLSWRVLGMAVLAGSAFACSPARPVLTPIPDEIPVDVRVRVISPELRDGWHPGRLVRSDAGCQVVTVAVARQPTPITILEMGQVRRLQRSQAVPQPAWWAEPVNDESWMEVDMVDLHRREAARCRGAN